MRHTILAISVMLVVSAATFAQDQSIVVEPQAAPPAIEETAPPVLQPPQFTPAPIADNEVMPPPAPAPSAAPVAMMAKVNPAPPMVYHAGPRARRMLRCQDQVQLVMVAKNPIDCCLYEIPLCVPACCEGQPAMREGRGILGRGVVEYCWPCGFKATVKFRPVLCDVKVGYTID